MSYGSRKKDGLTKYQRYYRRHRLKCLSAHNQYRRTHLAELANYMRQLRKRRPNLFKAIEKNRKRPADFRKKFNNYCKLWKKLNPDKRLASYQKRRAHTTMTIAAKQLSAMRTAQNGKCYYCQKPLDNRGRGHLEHKTPLSRGGEHALNNVCFACSTCNLKKGRRTEFEFLGLCIKTQ